jgi:hypothetical protein
MPNRSPRKPRDASQESLKGVNQTTGSGKVRGEDSLGSPKQNRPFAAAKQRAGSVRGR